MLALIAGTGDLPGAIVASLRQSGQPDPLICEMRGFVANVSPDLPRRPFRMEHLGSFLRDLVARGVTELCLAGALQRPQIDAGAIDAETMPMVPRLTAAMAKGDDGTLREFIKIFEEAGLTLRAAHAIAPNLLPPLGVLTAAAPTPAQRADIAVARAKFAAMGQADVGQACVTQKGHVIAQEAQDGTDAMLGRLVAVRDNGALCAARTISLQDAVFWKAPKPGQDLRADLPTIGPQTADRVVQAGLGGLVIAAGGVMVLDQPRVISTLDQHGLFLWVADI